MLYSLEKRQILMLDNDGLNCRGDIPVALRHVTTTLVCSLSAALAGPSARAGEETVIADTTLVTWVTPADLTQRGGRVLTIEKPDGVFDAIVYGDQWATVYCNGREYHAREQANLAVASDSELDLWISAPEARRYGVKVCRSADRREQTLIHYAATEKKLKIDTTHSSPTPGPGGIAAETSSLGAGEVLALCVFVDRSVVEVFASSRQAVMRRIHPSPEDSPGVVLFSDGGPATVEVLQARELTPSNPH